MSHGRIPMDPQMTWKLGPSAPCLFQVVPTALGQQPLPPPSKHLPPASANVSFPQHSDSGPPPLKRTLVIHGAPGTSRPDTPTSTSLTEPHLPHEVPGLGRGHT